MRLAVPRSLAPSLTVALLLVIIALTAWRALPVAAGWSHLHDDVILGRVVRSGSRALPEVALTFDDGPNPDATPQILDALERAHAVATFFVVGRAAAAYPRILQRMERDGDAVENHSWDHEYTVVETPGAFRASVQRTDAVILAATGSVPGYFRPPYGVRAPWTVHVAHRLGKTIVLWDIPLSRDWEQPGTSLIVERSLRGVRNGSIIVLHDGNEGRICAGTALCDRRQEIEATAILITRLRTDGYTIVTIPELLAARPPG